MNKQEMIQHENNKVKQKFNPSNELDLQVKTTEPHISSEYMSDNIKNKFRKLFFEKGVWYVDKDYFTNIEIYTQDMRLGNVDKLELAYMRHYNNLCLDILTLMPDDFNRSAFLCLHRSVDCSETSHSKNGWFRKLMNSIFQHQNIKEETPKKSSWFGFGKNKES